MKIYISPHLFTKCENIEFKLVDRFILIVLDSTQSIDEVVYNLHQRRRPLLYFFVIIPSTLFW